MLHAAQETGRSVFFSLPLSMCNYIQQLSFCCWATVSFLLETRLSPLHWYKSKSVVVLLQNPTACTLSPTAWFLLGCDGHSEPSPADKADLSPTPPQILRLHPPIQFIAIPDTPGYPFVPLSFSPSVIGLPIPNAAAPPTFIFGGYSFVAVMIHTLIVAMS